MRGFTPHLIPPPSESGGSLRYFYEARREAVAEIFGAFEARVEDALDRHVGCGARCEKRAQGPDEERGKYGTKVLGHARLLFFFDG